MFAESILLVLFSTWERTKKPCSKDIFRCFLISACLKIKLDGSPLIAADTAKAIAKKVATVCAVLRSSSLRYLAEYDLKVLYMVLLYVKR